MKLSNNNIWYQLLVSDFASNIEFYSYDCDIDCPRIIVSERPVIKQQYFGDHCNIIPFAMKSEEQFNKLVIESLLTAHKDISKTTYSNLNDVISFFKSKDLPYNAALISNNNTITGVCRKIKAKFNHIKLFVFDEIAENEVYFLPDPEYLGVIPIKPIDKQNELYGVGILNAKSIVKVIYK